MATPLRYALIFLLWAMVAVIYAPLIPAALTLISPALSLTHWQALFADPQLPQALLATLVSTTIAAVGALLIALLVIVALWPWPKWQRMCARLPWLLAIPHVAFATSALLLFAEGGLLYDYFPYFTPLMDKLGIGLGLTLAVKESAAQMKFAGYDVIIIEGKAKSPVWLKIKDDKVSLEKADFLWGKGTRATTEYFDT